MWMCNKEGEINHPHLFLLIGERKYLGTPHPSILVDLGLAQKKQVRKEGRKEGEQK
jgi:hypothetical protein